MSMFKKYKEIEEALEQKYKGDKHNEVKLEGDSFSSDGKLLVSGYQNLKQSCELISLREEIKITVPAGCVRNFKSSLEPFAARELSGLKKENKRAVIYSIVFTVMGLFWFGLWQVISYISKLNQVNIDMLSEVMIIITWVFIWAAVEKFFFERFQLRKTRYNILGVLSADVSEMQPEKRAMEH